MTDARVAVVTGASSGIGLEAAKLLAADGWRVIGTGRDAARTAAAAQALSAVATAPVDMLRADLSRMADVERLAAAIAERTDRIDLLLNNAGGMASGKVMTPEGLEENFAGNHLGPFLLTDRLLPLLRAAADTAARGAVRVVNTSSNGSEMIPDLAWDDLQLLDAFESGRAYCQGKLANVLFTRALAKRLAADGVIVHALHPGTVSTNFASHGDATMQAYIATLASIGAEEAGRMLVWLGIDPAAGMDSGGYYHGRARAAPNPVADDDAKVERLWRESEKLVADALGRPHPSGDLSPENPVGACHRGPTGQ